MILNPEQVQDLLLLLTDGARRCREGTGPASVTAPVYEAAARALRKGERLEVERSEPIPKRKAKR